MKLKLGNSERFLFLGSGIAILVDIVGSLLYGVLYEMRSLYLADPHFLIRHVFEAFINAFQLSSPPSLFAGALLAAWLVSDLSKDRFSTNKALWKGLLLGFLSSIATFGFSLVAYFLLSIYRRLSIENLILFNLVGSIISCIGGLFTGWILTVIASRYLSLNNQGTKTDKVKNQVV